MYNIYGVDKDTLAHMDIGRDTADGPIAMNAWINEVAGGKLQNKDTFADVGNTGLKHSGDGTVNYASLSWSHTMHLDFDNITVTAHAPRVRQFYDNFFGQWAEGTLVTLMNSNEPAYVYS